MLSRAAVYKNRLKKWGYNRNTKRSVVLAVERHKNEAEGNKVPVYLNERPLDMKRIENFRKRERIQASSSRPAQAKPPLPDLHVQGLVRKTQPNSAPSPTLASPLTLRTPEELISNMSNYIKGSFEVKNWRMNGMEQIIFSSKNQELDVDRLQSFLTALDTGCSNFATGDRYSGEVQWRKAFREIEPLVQGDYHDIIPNIVQKINDLNEGGHPQFAEVLKTHVAQLGSGFQQGHIKASIYGSLADVSLDQMRNLEEVIMRCCSDLFELYLGDRCYNSFVMKMDMARRRLSQGQWVDISDNLPALSILDHKFGLSDRRPLDVIRLRIETLYQRKQYMEARAHSSMLIQRAETIENDEWQRHYFLIKGLYYAGTSSCYITGNQLVAESNLSRCFGLIEDFYQLDHTFAMFDTEKIDIIERMEQMSKLRLDEDSYRKWNARKIEFQTKLNAMDNTIEMLEALRLQN